MHANHIKTAPKNTTGMALYPDAYDGGAFAGEKEYDVVLTQEAYESGGDLKIINRVAALDTLERVLCELPRDIHGARITLVDAPFDKELVLYLDRKTYFGAFTCILDGRVKSSLVALEDYTEYYDALSAVVHEYSSKYIWRHEKFMFRPLDYHKPSVESIPYECFGKNEKEHMMTAVHLMELQDELVHKCKLPRDVLNKICAEYGVHI